MKNSTLFKMMLLVVALIAGSASMKAQLLVENFDYTVGNTLTTTLPTTPPTFDPVTGWGVTGSSVATPITVTDGLSFAGYAGGGIGGAANVNNTGEDINKPFTAQTSGTVYTAFLIKTDASNSAGYFFHLGKNIIGSTFFSRIWVNGTGDGINVTNGSSAPASYITITPGTPTLLVLKFNFSTQKTDLFILNSFSATEPATSTVQIDETNITEIGSVALRQYNAAQRIVVDGIRVGNTWAEAVAPASSNPIVATPSLTPGRGNYITPQSVTISTTTAGASIYYTTDGTIPNNTGNGTLYNGTPINVNTTTTIQAIAYKDGMDPSGIGAAKYTFPTNVSNIAALRSSDLNGFYRLTGEAIVSLTTTARNAKYIQDATGGMLIDDVDGKITTTYHVGDGVTGILGTLTSYNGMFQFVPYGDPGAASSTGNTLTPQVITISQLGTDYQAKLIRLNNVTITENGTPTGTFAASTNYTITDASGTGVMRLQYADLPLVGQAIPSEAQDITGVLLTYNTTQEFIPISMVATTTGINTVAPADQTNPNAPLYNLAGQRVDKNYKGVVIQNGKKLINK